MNNGNIMDAYRVGVYSGLIKGRRPFALALIDGGEKYTDLCGKIEFFTTPLGVLVRVRIYGLPSKRHGVPSVYNLCVSGEDILCGSGCGNQKRRMCAIMPVVYEMNGSAECEMLTGRLLPSELSGKRIALYDRINGCPKKFSSSIANGKITSL